MLLRLINRLQRRPVVYDEHFFQAAWFKEWEKLSGVLSDLIQSETKWRSIVDFGCGPGVMIDLMTDHGLDYVGCDYSKEAYQLYLSHYGKFPMRYVSTLDEAISKKRDVLLAFDVLEHMRDEEIANLIANTLSIPEMFFNISRTRGIPGHINIKSDRAWLSFMESNGLFLDIKRTFSLRQMYKQLRPGSPDCWDCNIFLFCRKLL